MRSLSLPPVAIFIRRLFNVFSSITVSNQYFHMRRGEADVGRRDENAVNDGVRKAEELKPVRSEVLAASYERAAHENIDARANTSYNHWERLKPWPWSQPSRQPALRGTHTISIDEVKHRGPFKDDQYFDEKSPRPNDRRSRSRRAPSSTQSQEPLSPIQTLMNMPTLFDPIRVPRNPIVLCHGLYGYDVRGPSSFPILQLHYWSNVLKILKRKIGAEVILTGVPSTGSIERRAEVLDEYLHRKARGRDVNFVAHSMGGLDCRYLITHVKPKDYNPLSLMTICTPHRGSQFMDWCKENIGLGKARRQAEKASEKASEESKSSYMLSSLAALPSSLTTLLLSVLDSPAYANLSTSYLRDVFNPATPNDPRVKYYSIAARTDSVSVFHPLWLPKMVLDNVEAREREAHPHPEEVDWGNDGLVTVRSAKWGEFLGTLEGCDHWDVRGGVGLGPEAEWNIEIGLPAGWKNSLSDPLSNVKWRDLARLWKKEEEEKEERERKTTAESLNVKVVDSRAAKASSSRDFSSLGNGLRESNSSDAEDAALKSSTDKLSAIFDWISEQVASSRKPSNSSKPTSPSELAVESVGASGTAASIAQEMEKRTVDNKKKDEADDSRLKFDLEKFYVAICRKLYDDGL